MHRFQWISEYPLFAFSARVLSVRNYDHKYSLYTSPVCWAIAYYFAEKKSGTKLAKSKLELLSTHITTLPITDTQTKAAFADKKALDFEDGMQYYTALHGGCEAIITENKKDFYFSTLPVYSSKEFIENRIMKGL